MRFTFFCFLFVSLWCFAVYAQQDTIASKRNGSLNSGNTQSINRPLPDSAAIAKANRQKFIEDSIAMFYLRPDSLRENQFISSLWKNHLFDTFPQASTPLKQKSMVKRGQVRNSRDPWIIAVIIGLLLYTAMLNLFLSKDIKNVIQSFYNKHALSQVDKEGGLINSWAFVGLFLLFCLTFGLFLYQLIVYNKVYYSVSGPRLFISISMVIGLLFALKFIVLKFIGFVFGINRVVSGYIAVLNLTYFNIAFVFLSVAVCFSLLSKQFIPGLLIFTLALIGIILAWQYLRNSVNIISDFRFHKFYLFIYLCALEICPILILIKALNI
jgi:hypothetical protein